MNWVPPRCRHMTVSDSCCCTGGFCILDTSAVEQCSVMTFLSAPIGSHYMLWSLLDECKTVHSIILIRLPASSLISRLCRCGSHMTAPHRTQRSLLNTEPSSLCSIIYITKHYRSAMSHCYGKKIIYCDDVDIPTCWNNDNTFIYFLQTWAIIYLWAERRGAPLLKRLVDSNRAVAHPYKTHYCMQVSFLQNNMKLKLQRLETCCSEIIIIIIISQQIYWAHSALLHVFNSANSFLILMVHSCAELFHLWS